MTEVVPFALAVGTVAVQLALLGGAARLLLRRAGVAADHAIVRRVDAWLDGYAVHVALVLAAVATAGSLYMSNVLGWAPCRLCWFQRIFMYPLVLLLPVALALEKDDVADYVLPLALMGGAVAVWHAAVQRWEQFHAAGCSVLAVSCATEYTFYFGYVTVPVMAATAFAGIVAVLWRYG